MAQNQPPHYHWNMESLDWIDEELHQLQQCNLLRELPQPLRTQGARIELAGRQLINFASNDYLGLAADERLTQAAIRACEQHGIGRGASPLVCGRSEIHAQLEARLAHFLQTEAALLFSSSFAANAGIIPALVDRDDAIYGDAKNHASIIDGCRLSRAEKHVYPHTDMDALEEMLRNSKSYRRRLIVTDTLFSMDGDLAPLPQIVELANKYQAMLMLDETHAIGVFGSQGRGVAEHFAVEKYANLRIGTFGKALGAAGGFVCGQASLVKWLANRARTYVFSTAHPAAISAAAYEALNIVAAESSQRQALLNQADTLRQRLQQLGWNTGKSGGQIIPLLIGAPRQAVQISQNLLQLGIWLPAIRPPSVPPKESLLRLGLTAAHTDEMLEKFLAALQKVNYPG
ncbi:MAG TPA: 8-amino-7-oxononanoate synthase [Planctomycetaceae bacterium]|nr:8-amino-7-oxononanoate synthase [Planctomycetaceae bacterium]